MSDVATWACEVKVRCETLHKIVHGKIHQGVFCQGDSTAERISLSHCPAQPFNSPSVPSSPSPPLPCCPIDPPVVHLMANLRLISAVSSLSPCTLRATSTTPSTRRLWLCKRVEAIQRTRGQGVAPRDCRKQCCCRRNFRFHHVHAFHMPTQFPPTPTLPNQSPPYQCLLCCTAHSLRSPPKPCLPQGLCKCAKVRCYNHRLHTAAFSLVKVTTSSLASPLESPRTLPPLPYPHKALAADRVNGVNCLPNLNAVFKLTRARLPCPPPPLTLASPS